MSFADGTWMALFLAFIAGVACVVIAAAGISARRTRRRDRNRGGRR